MYVWKNVSKRDRRTRPVAPAELHLTKQKTVLAEVEGRAARQRRELEQQRALYKEQEAHEVDLFGREVKDIMLAYLETDHGKQELSRVVAALRAEQDLAEELQKRREIETLKEQEKREAEDHALGKAYAARKGNLEEQERKADKLREKLRRQGLLVEEPAEVDPKDVGWWDLLLTNRSRGFLKRRKFIKLVMMFTDVKWKQAAKLVDKLPSHVVRRVRRPQAERFRVELEKLGGKCALERGADEPPETQFDRDVKFLENQKKQRRSEGLRLQSVNAAAEELQDKELQRVMDTFNTFDADGSGAIDVDELGVLLKALCVPLKNKKELEDLMEDMDDDGSGDIDFDEFYAWYKEYGKQKQGGFFGKMRVMMLQASNAGAAAAGAVQVGEAKRIMCACAEEDAARYARLKFRQSRPRPLGADEDEAREAEEFRNAEKRFSCVRSVVGRPTVSGGGHDEHGEFAISDTPEYEARRLRANRLMFHPVLWPTPPPTPKDIPPLWMNAPNPSLSDPLQAYRDAEAMGATVVGVDPCKGWRSAPRSIKGLATIGSKKFLKGRGKHDTSLADAISSLRKDVAKPVGDVPAVFTVDKGAHTAQVLLRWRPELKPKPHLSVGVEGEFSGWEFVQLQPSKLVYAAYDAIVALPPGSYSYTFKIDGEYHLDPAAPQRGDPPKNVIHVVAEHAATSVGNLDIRLDGHGLKDDGAWALAGAIRAGGGGGALKKLSLASNGLSGDGAGALCATLERGDAPGLEVLDLSRNRIGRDGGRAVGKALGVERKVPVDSPTKKEGPRPVRQPTVPAPLVRCVLARCALADDGTAQVAMGLVGHGTLQRLDLNENAIGEYGAAAIARALLRNGVLTHISLAANRIDAKGCEHLSEPVRLSGTLLHLELNDNPRMGSLGAWWLGEALAGGSGELRDQVAADKAAKKRGEDPNGGALTLKTLAIAGVGSDEESEGEQPKTYKADAPTSSAIMRMGATLKAKAVQAKSRAAEKAAGVRQGSLEHLGLGDCQLTGDGTDLLGITALCSACERTKRLTSLDLANNALSDEAVRSLANALDRSKPTPIQTMVLRGNACDAKWLWRDHRMPASEADEQCAKTAAVTGKHVTYVPSIATTLAQSRKDRINAERERKGRKRARKQAELDLLLKAITPKAETDEERIRREDRGSSDNLRASRGSGSHDAKVLRRQNAREQTELRRKRREYERLKQELEDGVSDEEDVAQDDAHVLPPPPVSTETLKLAGEWTSVGWLPEPDKVAARLGRRQERERAKEAARTKDEDDAVEAAGAAAAAKANLAAMRVPDGVRLARAVCDEMDVDKKAKKAKREAAKKKREQEALDRKREDDGLQGRRASDLSVSSSGSARKKKKEVQKPPSKWCCGRRKADAPAKVKPRKSKDKDSWKEFRKRRQRSGSGEDIYRPRGSFDEIGERMGRIADPVGDAIRAKEAAKAEADHLAAVRALPTPKELKAMEKKKAEDEWCVILRLRLLIASTPHRSSQPARRHRRDASDESRRRRMSDTGSAASTPSLRPNTRHRRDAARRLRDTFQRVDMDHGGTVDAHELTALLIRLGWSHFTRQQLAEVYAQLDEDNSGEIDVEELILWWTQGGGKERVRRERRKVKAILRRILAKPKRLIFGPPKDARGGTDDPRVQDGVRCLEADASCEAQRLAREAYRRRRPPRDQSECVCQICGLSLVDKAQLALHMRDAKKAHRKYEKAQVAEKERRNMLERARLVVANELRAKEGRKAAKAQKGKFWKKKEDDVLQKRKRKKKKGKKDPPPFPVLLCFDSKVPHHAEVQTYDMPDEKHGRPTGAIGLKTCGVYCVADGLGNPLVTKGSGTEWLKVVWPSSCIGGGGAKAAAAAADTIRRAIAAQAGGAPLPKDPRLEPRALVWLRNRHPEHAKGKAPVFRPILAGETPYEKGRTPEELKLMQLNAEELEAARAKRSRLQKWIIYRKKEAIRKQQDLDEAEEVKRKMIMGGHIEFAVLPKTLKKGREVELFARPRWFRTHPSLPKFSKIKVRVVPEVGSYVVGELRWGHAVLAYGKAGHWLLIAFEKRDNAWILAKAPTRDFLQQVTSTVDISDLDDGVVSPQEVEPGACEEITAKAQRTVADEIQSLAALAEKADVSDAELAALGDARFEQPTPVAPEPSGASPSANLSVDERSQATGAERSQVTLETGASSAVRSTG